MNFLSFSDLRSRLFPSLKGYQLSSLPADLLAGLAIAAVGIPSAIAYPAIAGLPPETGLYASIAPLIAYAIFGPSRRLVVGPDAATMTVLASIMAQLIASMPADQPANPAALASGVAIGVAITCLVARFLRLGVLATFLSRPILTGFFAGISLSILVGQIGRFTGMKLQSDGLLSPLVELAGRLNEVQWPSVILGLAMLALIIGLKYRNSLIPGSVAAIVVATALSAAFDLQAIGIKVVGEVPSSLPRLSLPDLRGVPLNMVAIGAISTFLVSFGAGIITAKSFGQIDKEPVDPNRELEGFAAANFAAGLFGAFPVTSSDSRTAVGFSVGSKSQIASVSAALTLVGVVLFLGNALSILPIPALGAILVAAAAGLIDIEAMRRLRQISKVEFALAIAALIGPIMFGVLEGVAIVIGITLGYVLWKMMYPKDALLGVVPGRTGFYKLHRTPTAAPVPGLALGIVQGSVLFFNADYVRGRIAEIAADLPAGTRWFVLDATPISQIDVTGASALEGVQDDLAARGIRFGLAELHADVRDLLQRAGVYDRIGSDMIFDDLSDALATYERQFRTAAPPPTAEDASVHPHQGDTR